MGGRPPSGRPPTIPHPYGTDDPMPSLLKRLAADDSGATMVEYGIMLALIAAVCLAVIKIVGQKTNNVFNDVSTQSW